MLLIFANIFWKEKLNLKYYNTKYNEHSLEEAKFNENDFIERISQEYSKRGFVNLNEIESKIKNGRNWIINDYKNKNEINIGFQIDSNYVLRCMMTLTSIMDSQKKSVRIRFHFAVVLKFDVKDMIKIYTLRKRVREDVEFNFYNARKVETDLIGLNTKGPGAVAKLLLPELVSGDIGRLLVFDTGDLIIIKDLSEMYNWEMSGHLYAGVPASAIGKYAKISKKFWDIYISVGSFLIDIKKVKTEKMYEKFVRYKNEYKSPVGDQDLLNDVAFGKITYLPFKYGMICPYINEIDSENAKQDNIFSLYANRLQYTKKYKFLPKNELELFQMSYSPYIIHHMHSKWMFGGGLTLYRKLAQYYIKYAGIWEELCIEYPGYCKN